MEQGLATIKVLGVTVISATTAGALAAIERLGDAQDPASVVYVNAHTLNLATKDPPYRDLLRSADLVVNDGSGLAIAARLKGRRFPENLNGTDLNPRILDLCSRRGWSVFFLGAAPGVAEGAAQRLAVRIPGLKVAGHHHGYFPRENDQEVGEEIGASGADVLMVAMGNPLQERWLIANLDATGCRLGIGVGAFFDFTAERVRRAPSWISRMGLEWMWRLAQEPSRMWRRYVLGNPAFLWRVVKETIRERRGTAA